MNTGAIITTAGAFFTAVATIIVGAFVRRGDRSAKLSKQYFDDAAYNMALVGALRDDYWGVANWAYQTRTKWHRLLDGLPSACSGAPDELQSLLTDIGDLPELPAPKHVLLERQHAKQTEIKDD